MFDQKVKSLAKRAEALQRAQHRIEPLQRELDEAMADSETAFRKFDEATRRQDVPRMEQAHAEYRMASGRMLSLNREMTELLKSLSRGLAAGEVG